MTRSLYNNTNYQDTPLSRIINNIKKSQQYVPLNRVISIYNQVFRNDNIMNIQVGLVSMLTLYAVYDIRCVFSYYNYK